MTTPSAAAAQQGKAQLRSAIPSGSTAAGTGPKIKTGAGDAPVIPILLILGGGYLAWFGTRYWRDQAIIWPSDPVKSVLQGKGLPAPSREQPARVAGFMQQEEQAGSNLQGEQGTGGQLGLATGSMVAKAFMKYDGKVRYIWGGARPNPGWDCSGALNYVACHDVGLDIPGYKGGTFDGSVHGPVVSDWIDWEGVTHIASATAGMASIRAGDILAWGPDVHIGVAISSTHFISAQDPALGTGVASISGASGLGIFVAMRLKQVGQQAGGAGRNKQIGSVLAGKYGWSPSQNQGEWNSLVKLWDRESEWSTTAENPSGAYGIPQALPGNKMAKFGGNWKSSAQTQIRWGLWYIKTVYGNPSNAWAHEEAQGWY